MSGEKGHSLLVLFPMIGVLSRFSKEMEDRNPRSSEGRLGGLAISPGKGYSRVPSKGTISTSTTSTSLVTDYTGSHTHLYLPKTLLSQDHYPEEYLKEEEQSLRGDDEDAALTQDEEQEDFEQTRKHFQQLRQTSLGSANKFKMENKEENLRNTVPYLKSLARSKNLKDAEYIIDADPSPYTPTTQKIYRRTQTVAALAVSLGSLVVGYTSAYTSPALVTMVHENSTVQVTKYEGSWVGGLMPLAALFGGVIGGPLIEKFGRRSTILAISVPFIISWVIIALASNVSTIYTGRALSGICVGVGSLSFPVYLGEVLQPEVRGKLGLLPTAFGNIGILICFIVGKYVNWSELAWLGAALPVPFFVMMQFIPETPRWLISRSDSQKKKGIENLKKARRALKWLKGNNVNVEYELNELIFLHNEGKKNATGSALSELFKRKYARSILISLGLMLFQQMSGINAVIFYTVTIFQEAESSIDGNLCTIIVGIVNFISTFIATGLIESLGRKILLYISGVAMFLTLMILGFFFYFQNVLQYETTSFGWLPLASFIIYVTGFSLGFGPIPWLMMGEILPARIRGTAASLITAFNWACTFLVTKTFLSMKETIGIFGAFWMYGAICLFGLLFTFLYVPETKGKSLEEIEELLSGKRRLTSDSDIAEKERMEC